jgi:DNA-directed RNA polymerase subunit M/transcription elongation factor TFIIS
VKQSFINRITLCDSCNSAFIISEEGDDSTCDSCLAENEITYEIIDSGDLFGLHYDNN